jgi:hypothetical protein
MSEDPDNRDSDIQDSDITDSQIDEPDTDEIAPVEAAPKAKRGVGFKTLGLGVILASLFGAGGGAFLSQTLQKPSLDMSPLKETIEELQSENKTLTAQITRLQRDIKALPVSNSIDLTPIESRLDAIEKAEAKSLDPDLVERLEALNTDGSKVMDLADILARLDVLENAKPQSLDAELVARLETLSAEQPEGLDLSDIIVRLEALETAPVAVVPAAIVAPDVTVAAPFPKADILTALEASQPKEGWFKRALDKHISVQSEDNPEYLVELIVKNLEDENLEAALAAFDKLPAEAKAAGQSWRESLAN